MKVCEICGKEVWSNDGDNRCMQCDQLETKKAERRARNNTTRKTKEAIMRMMGLVKVKGELGGTYWE